MKRLLLLDSHALLFRAYHAMPALTTPEGRPSGAVAGFANVLVRLYRELEPTWIVACFDAPGPTFREELYPAYKATRVETPPDIITQEPMIKDLVTGFGIPHWAIPGFEADDLIATLTSQALKTTEVNEVVVATGDRDLLQLSQPKVSIYLIRTGDKSITLLDEAGVTELMQLPPSQLLEWKALRGDPSDNIIGVPGVGDKTALGLITKAATLEHLYQKLETADGAKDLGVSDRIRAVLLEYKARAFANRELLRVRYDAPVTLDLRVASTANYREAQARQTLASFGFKTILGRLPKDQTTDQPRLF